MTIRVGRAFALVLAGALAACSGPVPEDSLIRGPARLGGFSTTVGEPKDFVTEKRIGDTAYIPVGFTPAKRPITPKTPAELDAYEKNLDASRTAAETFATRPAPAMKPLRPPNKLPPIPGSKLDPSNPDNQQGSDDAATYPVPPGLRPKLIQNP